MLLCYCGCNYICQWLDGCLSFLNMVPCAVLWIWNYLFWILGSRLFRKFWNRSCSKHIFEIGRSFLLLHKSNVAVPNRRHLPGPDLNLRPRPSVGYLNPDPVGSGPFYWIWIRTLTTEARNFSQFMCLEETSLVWPKLVLACGHP